MEKEKALYRDFAKYYDKVYSKKDYKKEAEFINSILLKHKINGGVILDMACGTGSHANLLIKKGYRIFGIDENLQMIKLAKQKNPQAIFKVGKMQTFKLGRKFDAIICMFTAINYNVEISDLIKTLKNFKKHLSEDGVIIFDFPLPKHTISHASRIDKATMVLYDNVDIGNIRDINIYWIFEKGLHIETVKDVHKVRLYSLKEYSQAIKKSGLRHKVYWGFSTRAKSGKRAVIVCTK